MSDRKSRRAVMAALLLLANPSHIYVHTEGVALSVKFDSVADLKSWLNLAGLLEPDLLMSERQGTSDDGRPYLAVHAYPQWHGWEFYASAREFTDGRGDLDTQTAGGLAALAVTG